MSVYAVVVVRYESLARALLNGRCRRWGSGGIGVDVRGGLSVEE